MPTELEKQVAQEAAEIQQAPRVPSLGHVQRCGFCGQLANSGSEVRGPVPVQGEQLVRWRGSCCGG